MPRLWAGHAAFIIAGGPSVATQDLSLLRGRKVVVVNSSYEAYPAADYLIFHDERWWFSHKAKLSGFAGRIVAVDDKPRAELMTLRDCGPKCPKRKPDTPPRAADWTPLLPSFAVDAVPVRNTTLTGAIDFVRLLGARCIVLLGADGKNDGARKHHHSEHCWAQVPHAFAEQRIDLDSFAPAIARRGVTILNASPGSALPHWPVMSLAAAIARVDAEAPDEAAQRCGNSP